MPALPDDLVQRGFEPARHTVFTRSCEPGFQRELRGVELRRDFFAEARHQRVLPPFGTCRQRCECGPRFRALPYALEWFVVAIFDQGVEAGGLRFFVQKIAAEDLQQARLGQERRKCEKHEVALGTMAAPAVRRLGAEKPEIAVATGKCIEVRATGFRERARDRYFGKRPQ